MTLDRFATALQAGMMSLPQDMKAMLRIAEDPDLDEGSRVLACGALLHVLLGANAIPGVKGTLGFADDVLVLRLTVDRIAKSSPDIIKAHHDAAPEIFEPMSEQLEAARSYLGDRIGVLERTLDGLPKITYEGHNAQLCAKDQEAQTWLYDSVHEAIVERLELNEDDVARAVKSASDIKTKLEQRH
jgi:uncharacterized membrane protein YkvA (DUF1232 family)